MANAYIPPGVFISETFSPAVSPLLASPADVCIVGVAGDAVNTTQTDLQTTDVVIMSGTTAHLLPTIASLNSDAQLTEIVSVMDLLDPSYGTPAGSGYVATTDYTADLGIGPPDGTHGTITRVGGGNIPDGRPVAVTYKYVPSDYWNAVRLFDIGSVESRFGPSYAVATNSVTGQSFYTGVNSQLSMAARIAFENGAQSVVCQPLFMRQVPGDPTSAQLAPTDVAVGELSTWQDTLHTLQPIEDIDVIVPIIGQDGVNVSDSTVLSVFTAVQSHIAFQNSNQQYIVAVFGEDGTIEGIGNNSSGLMQVMRNTHAPGLQGNFGNALSNQCVLINNTVFTRATPGSSNTSILLGGQYAAAAVAGALGGRSVSSSLTRKPILGFQSITDPRTPTDKNSDAAAGMFVIEQVKGLIRCRQAITLDTQNGPEFAELSVVRSKHLMMESIKQTLEDQVIGNIIADANSPLVVRSAIAGVLQLLIQSRVIIGYTALQAQLTSLNPTTISASFTYQAAFPVNFVNITFALDMSTGAVTFQTT